MNKIILSKEEELEAITEYLRKYDLIEEDEYITIPFTPSMGINVHKVKNDEDD